MQIIHAAHVISMLEAGRGELPREILQFPHVLGYPGSGILQGIAFEQQKNRLQLRYEFADLRGRVRDVMIPQRGPE